MARHPPTRVRTRPCGRRLVEAYAGHGEGEDGAPGGGGLHGGVARVHEQQDRSAADHGEDPGCEGPGLGEPHDAAGDDQAAEGAAEAGRCTAVGVEEAGAHDQDGDHGGPVAVPEGQGAADEVAHHDDGGADRVRSGRPPWPPYGGEGVRSMRPSSGGRLSPTWRPPAGGGVGVRPGGRGGSRWPPPGSAHLAAGPGGGVAGGGLSEAASWAWANGPGVNGAVGSSRSRRAQPASAARASASASRCRSQRRMGKSTTRAAWTSPPAAIMAAAPATA